MVFWIGLQMLACKYTLFWMLFGLKMVSLGLDLLAEFDSVIKFRDLAQAV